MFDDRGPESSGLVGVGEVDVAHFLKVFPATVVEKGPGQTFGVFRGQLGVGVPDGRKSSEPTPRGRITGRKVDIRAFILDSDLQILVNVCEDFVL